MAISTEPVLEDLQRVVGELEGMARSATERIEEKIGEARDRISDAERSAGKKIRRGLHTAGRHVRDNPWELVATVAAVAFMAGLLLGRRT